MSSGVGLALLLLVGVTSLAIGVFASSRFVKTSDDYLVAGRVLGAGLIGGTLVAAYCNSYTIFVNGALASGFPFGNYMILLIVGLAGPIMLGGVIANRVRKRFRDGYTQPEFLARRFGTSMHMYGTLVQVVNHLILLVAQIMVGGLVLQQLFNVPAWLIMVLITLSMILYTLGGGMWASVATDYLQIIAAVAAMVIIMPLAIMHFGGPGDIYQGILSARPDYFGFQGDAAFWKLVASTALIIFAGVVVPQYIWQRFLSARDNAAVWKGLGSVAIIYPAMAAVGAIPAYIVMSQGITLGPGDEAPLVFLDIVPGWILVPFALIILLFIISTADSVLMALVSLATVDLYAKYFRRGEVPDREMLKVNRIALVVFALISLAVAFFKVTVLELWFTWGFIVLTLTGPILLGLFGRRVTGSQATVGAVAGLLLAGWLYWLSPWENDSLVANLAALFVPIAVSHALASLSDQRYSWDDDEPTTPPAGQGELEFAVGR